MIIHMQKHSTSKRITAIARTLLSLAIIIGGAVHAEKFTIPDFQPNDRWIYNIRFSIIDNEPSEFLQEYFFIGWNANGKILLLSRTPNPNDIWTTRVVDKKCFLFLTDPIMDVAEAFCGRDINPGTRKENAPGYTLTFEGLETLNVLGEQTETSHFSIAETLRFKDSDVPNARTRRWDFWHSRKIRSFPVVEMRFFDEGGKEVKSIRFNLVKKDMGPVDSPQTPMVSGQQDQQKKIPKSSLTK